MALIQIYLNIDGEVFSRTVNQLTVTPPPIVTWDGSTATDLHEDVPDLPWDFTMGGRTDYGEAGSLSDYLAAHHGEQVPLIYKINGSAGDVFRQITVTAQAHPEGGTRNTHADFSWSGKCTAPTTVADPEA